MADKRTEVAKQRLREKTGKNIVIYGDSCHKTSGNAKLIYYMAKAFQQGGHKVFTIGMEYNGPQVYYDDVPILPGFLCSRCGEANKGDNQTVQKIAEWLKLLRADYFICVGDPIKFQEYGIGNITFERSKVITIMYSTIDSEVVPWTNELLKEHGFRDYLEVCDQIVSASYFGQEQFSKWMDIKDVPVIHECVDHMIYSPVTKERKKELREEHRFKQDDFIMYYSGRNTLRKRVFDLIEASTQFICETDNTYLYLNIPPMGRTRHGQMMFPDTINPVDFIKRPMKRLYGRDLLDEGRIIFVDREELGSSKISNVGDAEFHQLSDIYVNTNAGEGFGLCPVNSMNCGVPAIIPDNTTSREILGYVDKPLGNSAFKVAKGGLLTNTPITLWQTHCLRQNLTTPQITYEAIKYLYNNPGLREKLGEEGRKHAINISNFELFKKKWNELVRKTKKKEPVEKEFKTLVVEGDENDKS